MPARRYNPRVFMPLALTAATFAAAIISGITGLAGGTLLVASMFALRLQPAVAVPVHAAVQLVSNGTRTVVFGRHVALRALALFLVTAMPTPFLAAPWVAAVNPHWVRLVMALFILLITWAQPRSDGALRLQGPTGLLLAGLLAGGFGMVVGATGTLIAPFFLRDEWSKETVIGTKALCQAAAHVLKIAAFSTRGFIFGAHLDLIAPMSVAAVVGTIVGKRIGTRLGDKTFQLIFRLLLTVLSIKLGIDAVAGLSANA